MAQDLDKLARLTSVRTEMEAGIIVGGLEARDIPATMTGTFTTNFRAEAPGWVDILVAEPDLPRAASVLEQVGREHEDVDWSQVDVGEPEVIESEYNLIWWTSLRLWRRVAFVLIVGYLAWFAIVFLAGIIGRIGRAN